MVWWPKNMGDQHRLLGPNWYELCGVCVGACVCVCVCVCALNKVFSFSQRLCWVSWMTSCQGPNLRVWCSGTSLIPSPLSPWSYAVWSQTLQICEFLLLYNGTKKTNFKKLKLIRELIMIMFLTQMCHFIWFYLDFIKIILHWHPLPLKPPVLS